MPKAFAPRPYQHDIIRYLLANPRCAVWAGMGTGKTVSTLTALSILTLTESGPALVIAPLRVAQSTWPDEAAKWQHLAHLKIAAITGDAKRRAAALASPADIYTINYENLPWLVAALNGAWPFATVVADESTRLKSFRLRQGGQRARSLGRVAHRAAHFIELTGTPSPNGLQDLWGQAWFIDKGERLGRTYGAFQARWFHPVRVGADAHAVQHIPQPYAQSEIEGKLRDRCLTIDAKDHFSLSDPITNLIHVTLPPKAMRLYLDMERDMYLQLASGHTVEAFNAASQTIKCLQLANGALYTDDKGNWQAVHDAKLQALESVIEEAAGMPVLVAYHFKSDLARLQKRLPQGRALDKSPATLRDWNAGKIPVLFAHPESAGHGLNLQDGGNILVFFAHWWALEPYQQIIERIGPVRQAQSGHRRPVYIHHIIAAGTLDEQVMARRDSKRSVQEQLLEAMKTRSNP